MWLGGEVCAWAGELDCGAAGVDRHTGDRLADAERGVPRRDGNGDEAGGVVWECAGGGDGDYVAADRADAGGSQYGDTFGDGAGAVLISPESGFARVVDSCL